ncbi:M3 family oligoendopeptidase [Patescibacteria group bacterium]|nr:M3 family oligoendopeptidase [Patescibacteria group bacterium]
MSSLPQWTLSDLFTSPQDPAIRATFTQARQATDELNTLYRGKLEGASASMIADLFARQERVVNLISKPVAYASLFHVQNMLDSEREGLARVMQDQATAIERDLLWIDVELGQLPETILTGWINDPACARYAHPLSKIAHYKNHLLPEEQEKLVNDLQQTGAEAFRTLFEQEDSTKLFPFRGENLPLTAILHHLSSSDRAIRADAAQGISEGLAQDEQRRAFIYTTLIKHKQTIDRYRAFATPEASRHLANETTQASVEALVQAVNKTQSVFQRYYHWKAERLSVNRLAHYDRYAPLLSTTTIYTWEEAKAIVLEAFTAFSPEFGRIAQEFFDRGWIDAHVSPGKRGGAFCSYVTADHHPYIMVNFQGRINNVLTLAHELGHGIHAYLARPQGTLQFSTPLTLAETASVFGEMLVFDLLRKRLQDQPTELQALCAQKLEGIFATVFRQITLFQFEQLAHAHVREHGFATAETYNRLWTQIHTPLFGDAIDQSEGYTHWWSYISHFFAAPFYVYAYAYGELLTCCLYERYTATRDPAFVEAYKAFLAKGGSADPVTLLNPLSINPDDPATWERGLAWIEHLLDETLALDAKIRPSA